MRYKNISFHIEKRWRKGGQKAAYLHRMETEKEKSLTVWGLRKNPNRAGEMTHWLRALTALPEVSSSIPSTHMAADNCP